MSKIYNFNNKEDEKIILKFFNSQSIEEAKEKFDKIFNDKSEDEEV